MKVRVEIKDKERKIGAMVKALAVEVAGFQAIKGTTKEFLKSNGNYDFDFPSLSHAEDFKASVGKYLSIVLAEVVSA
jgi:hypothetical protein